MVTVACKEMESAARHYALRDGRCDRRHENRLYWSLLDIRGMDATGPCGDFLRFCARNLQQSRAQIFQDLFVLFLLKEKAAGYFVEFGATDGMTCSNTCLLEQAYGWSGILAEPARIWHRDLKRNRACAIDLRCLWSTTGQEQRFHEADDPELSTIESFSDLDYHAKARRHGSEYVVESVSLCDLLRHHDAPSTIDYLSVDTEGSEFKILSNFDFDRYDVRIITVEHNYNSMRRAQVHRLLTSRGYERLFENLSMWDDWYLKR